MSEPTAEDRRLSFGETAAAYDRFRPSYPEAALRWALGDSPLRVLDLGAGTGLMTAVLLDLGHWVDAVEPDAGMRHLLSSRVAGRASVHEGSAESIPLPDGSVDAVVTAQAFHWFDLDRALPEMARVLTDGGRLAVVWNTRDDDVPWVDEVSALVGRLDARSGNRDADLPAVSPQFVGLERATFHHDQDMDADGLVNLVSTFSYVALSPMRDEVLGKVRALTTDHPDLAGRQRFSMPYETVVYRATKDVAAGVIR